MPYFEEDGQRQPVVDAKALIGQAPEMIPVMQRPFRPGELVAAIEALAEASTDPVVAQALALSQTFCKSKGDEGEVILEQVSMIGKGIGFSLVAYMPNGKGVEVRNLGFSVPDKGRISMALSGDRWQLNGGKQCEQAFDDLSQRERARFVGAMMTALQKVVGV